MKDKIYSTDDKSVQWISGYDVYVQALDIEEEDEDEEE